MRSMVLGRKPDSLGRGVKKWPGRVITSPRPIKVNLPCGVTAGTPFSWRVTFLHETSLSLLVSSRLLWPWNHLPSEKRSCMRGFIGRGGHLLKTFW